MDGVKTALIGFILVCIIFPSVIKSKHQYYLGLAAVLLSMVMQMLGVIFVHNIGMVRAFGAVEIMLEMAALLILVMAAGGLSARQLAGDMSKAIEVMRRGEESSELLIRAPGQPRVSRQDREEQRERIAIDDDDNDPLYDPKRFNPAPQNAPPPPAAEPSIPVEEPPKG